VGWIEEEGEIFGGRKRKGARERHERREKPISRRDAENRKEEKTKLRLQIYRMARQRYYDRRGGR